MEGILIQAQRSGKIACASFTVSTMIKEDSTFVFLSYQGVQDLSLWLRRFFCSAIFSLSLLWLAVRTYWSWGKSSLRLSLVGKLWATNIRQTWVRIRSCQRLFSGQKVWFGIALFVRARAGAPQTFHRVWRGSPKPDPVLDSARRSSFMFKQLRHLFKVAFRYDELPRDAVRATTIPSWEPTQMNRLSGQESGYSSAYLDASTNCATAFCNSPIALPFPSQNNIQEFNQ